MAIRLSSFFLMSKCVATKAFFSRLKSKIQIASTGILTPFRSVILPACIRQFFQLSRWSFVQITAKGTIFWSKTTNNCSYFGVILDLFYLSSSTSLSCTLKLYPIAPAVYPKSLAAARQSFWFAAKINKNLDWNSATLPSVSACFEKCTLIYSLGALY